MQDSFPLATWWSTSSLRRSRLTLYLYAFTERPRWDKILCRLTVELPVRPFHLRAFNGEQVLSGTNLPARGRRLLRLLCAFTFGEPQPAPMSTRSTSHL
jgi:hypothetical protein